MAAFPCNTIRTVEELISIPEILLMYLRVFQASQVEAIEYMDARDAHLTYVSEHLRPYAAVLNACIPATVRRPSEMPKGRAEELAPFIVSFIEHCRMDTRRAQANRPFLIRVFAGASSSWTSSTCSPVAPNYGFSSATRSVFLGRASSASSLSLAGRVDGSAFDVPLSGEYLSLPAVPPWTEEDIGRLRAEEESYAWSAEEMLLQDHIDSSKRVDISIAKAVAEHEAGHAPHASGRYQPVPTSRRLSATDLTALWIIRVRFLAAQLHHITTIARESETPPRTVEVIRSGVRELAKNMVDLGRASVEHGMDRGTRNDARFFVPAEATALFAMIERFIDSYGYLEDDLTPNREVLFGNLEILRTCMIEAVDYLLAPDDFPNFPLNAVERDWYAFPATLKAHQVTMLRATHVPKRKFGDNLRRYNSELDSSRWYNFPDPTLALVPTRPNTPEVATITWIAVDACALNTGIVIRRATPVQEGSASGAEAEEGELPGEE
ncbi:hypothetical protein DFH06DRAFT_1141417 [Mycena polygramma]|nr:hypothetical protein DFH06DRAFT_1141417 [Mycena polygramma]